jgi:hypothetical protein
LRSSHRAGLTGCSRLSGQQREILLDPLFGGVVEQAEWPIGVLIELLGRQAELGRLATGFGFSLGLLRARLGLGEGGCCR